MDSTAAQSTATLATGLPKENESVLSRCQFDCRGISKRRINPRYPVTSAAKAATSLRSTPVHASPIARPNENKRAAGRGPNPRPGAGQQPCGRNVVAATPRLIPGHRFCKESRCYSNGQHYIYSCVSEPRWSSRPFSENFQNALLGAFADYRRQSLSFCSFNR